MKVRIVPPLPPKPVREFIFTEDEATLVRDLLGKFTDEQLAKHFDLPKNGERFRRLNERADALFNDLTENL